MSVSTSSRLRIGLVIATLATSALVATTAWTGGGPQSSTGFVCDNGDRFVVEFLTDHVRLRHGSGVFALATVKPGYLYSDGRILLHTGLATATLEHLGSETRQHCTAIKV